MAITTPNIGRRAPMEDLLSAMAGYRPSPTAVRLMVGIAAPAIAYHYSLLSLLRNLNVETPLAYLGLVPAISLVLIASRARPGVNEPPIHDRQLDYIVGVPLLLAAILLQLLLPVRLSTMFWVWRLDLLSFPLFVAGTIALLFGVRTLWRVRLAVGFLLLAWPLPYSVALLRWLDAFTNFTLWGVKLFLHAIPVATAAADGDGSLFLVEHAGETFKVSVASPCSGVNGIVGFLLVSLAFLTVVAGPIFRKILWLAAGLSLIWTLNVLRIILIFWGGSQWGETVAIDGLHPFIGLITFNLGVLAMVLMLNRFGLALRLTPRRRRGAAATPNPRQAVPRWRLACAVVAALGLTSGVANASLKSYDLVASALGAARLTPFSLTPAVPTGWSVVKADEYTWARRFFGEDSTWVRWRYAWNGDESSTLRSGNTVIGDVIQTGDLGSFSTYGVEACYRFHGYKLQSVRAVDLGGGVVGNVLSYRNTKLKTDWTTVYWHWPVRNAEGSTRYERVVLMISNAADTRLDAPLPSPSVARSIGLRLQNALGQNQEGTDDHRLAKIRSFVVGFAADLIQHQKDAPPDASNK